MADPGRRLRRLLQWGAAGVVLGSGYLAAAHWAVTRAATGHLFETPARVPSADVAVVLGTARTIQGRLNLFYLRRIDAAAELYREGRVRGLLVSGDNSRSDYNEPEDMKADLVARGVPAEVITCDYAGLRTLDSVQRARRVFGQRRVVFVSQRFHLERALYLAASEGLLADGLVAADVPLRGALKVRLREVVARGAALLDVAVGRRARWLGPPETVALRPPES